MTQRKKSIDINKIKEKRKQYSFSKDLPLDYQSQSKGKYKNPLLFTKQSISNEKNSRLYHSNAFLSYQPTQKEKIYARKASSRISQGWQLNKKINYKKQQTSKLKQCLKRRNQIDFSINKVGDKSIQSKKKVVSFKIQENNSPKARYLDEKQQNFEDHFRFILNGLLLLYIKVEIFKFHSQKAKMTSRQAYTQLSQEILLSEAHLQYLCHSLVDPFRDKSPSETKLVQEFEQILKKIATEQKRLKKICIGNGSKTISTFLNFLRENKQFSKTNFFEFMYNTENRPHISSLNFIKVEMFTEKVIQKGGMEEFLQWVKSK